MPTIEHQDPIWTPPPPYGTPPAPPSGSPSRSFLVMVLVTLLAVGAAGIAAVRARTSTPAAPVATLADQPANVDALAAAVEPAVVDIDTRLGYQNARAAGTGVVISSTGEVLTNNHVIDGATSITATEVTDGTTYTAHVVGYDVTHDLAVLQLTGASHLATAKIATSGPAVGAATVAIGNAGGTGGTPAASTGNVTRLGVSIVASDDFGQTPEQLSGLIQTDAQLEPGDSGGPLVDTNGRVVGINTATSSRFSFRDAGSASFAIPISTAIDVANRIERGSSSSTSHVGGTAFLGVQVSSADGEGGAVVAAVEDGTPAASTDLESGDVVTALDGTSVSSPSDLTAAIEQHRPGDRVRIEWTDQSGDTHHATVTLGSGPAH